MPTSMTPTRGSSEVELPEERSEVTVDVVGRTMRISNLAKVMYPETGTTKGEVLHYYAQVAPVLLPHVRDRPVTRIRWPDGTGAGRFFEKNLPAGAPRWLRAVPVRSSGSRGRGDTVTYPVIDGIDALTYLVNLGSLELHVPQWRFGRNNQPTNPDRLVIDLDPGPPAGLHECCRVALLVRDRLADRGMPTAPVTSGSKGLHLYAALPGRKNAEAVRDEAQQVARELAEEQPDLVVWKMTKSLRSGKVLLDWSQNTAAKTTIAPYSLRGTPAPYVAAPRAWEEVERGAARKNGIRQLLLEEMLGRLESDGDVFGEQLTR